MTEETPSAPSPGLAEETAPEPELADQTAVQSQPQRMNWTRVVIVSVVVALVAFGLWRATEPSAPVESASGDDPVSVYETALAEGRPVFVLIHSNTCASCVDMVEACDVVVPEYADDVVFVDALTDCDGTQDLAQRFGASYIPTSVFVAASGEVVNTVIGPMEPDALRTQMDAILTTY